MTYKSIKTATPKALSLPLFAGFMMCLSACASTQNNGHSKNFSDATAHNRAAQEVLPTAKQKNDTFIPADANRQAIARENYRNNEVLEPARISTR